ncbi:hypothetical protein ACET3X_002508 [Alternaria dauci]|uniref:Uncharacterized protein n=1 Tax=Alternaria dauci TaxID=48095 RepID=A0ABR3USR8_9PLEO
MNNNASFPDRQRVAPDFTSISPIAAPVAQIFPESAGLNVFDLDQDGEFFPTEQPATYADGNRIWRYDLPDSHQADGNFHHQQLPSGLILPEEPWNFRPGRPLLFDTNVALGTPNDFGNSHLHPPVEPTPSYDNGYPVPSPKQSDNSQVVDAGEDTGTLEVVDAVNDALLDKEKRAKAVLKTQRGQKSAAKQMGESVTLSQTDTGIHIGGVYWTAPADDSTIPSSPAEINACIDALTKAMQNRENCREKTTTGQYRNRWMEGSTYYSEDQFKAAARDLVLAMIEIHKNGWTKTIYDKGERENCQVTMFYTFEDRFEALRELLHCSKTTCQDILKGSRFHTIIGNPRTLTFRTATNKNANAHKAGLIAKGKVTANGKKRLANEAHSGSEERSEEGDSLEPKKSPPPPKPSTIKKRTHGDIVQAEGEPSDNASRPKVAIKKRRKA